MRKSVVGFTIDLRNAVAHRKGPLRSGRSAHAGRRLLWQAGGDTCDDVAHRSPTDEFVGRRVELATFERAMADARGGLPSVLLVGGDAGIGKSTLIVEAARRAGAPLYVGRCVHVGGEDIPLAPVADLLRQVRRSMPEVLANPGPLSSLVRWFTPDPEVTQPGTGVGGVFAPVLDLIGRLASDDAVVVAVEDLHWADAATWDLFDLLARNLIDERVVLVGTHRVNETNTDPSHRRRLVELSRVPGVQRILLTGLDRADVTARVHSLVGSPASSVLIEDVISRGQGNPFFTEQLVAAHLAGEAIPIVLSDLISADIEALAGPTRSVLDAVAAVGRGTSHGLLEDVADLSPDIIEVAVREAVDAGMLVVENDAYWFRHALISEVVYAELLPPGRTRLHRRIADAMLGGSPGALARAVQASELAFHLVRAGDAGAAFTALLSAADAAESVAPGAAFRHLERALELWDVAGERAVDERRGGRLWQAAELADGTVGSERAVELAREAFTLGPPPKGVAWGHERLGRYLWMCGRLEESQTEFERAAAMLTGEDGPEASGVLAGLAQAEFMAGRYESADVLSRRAIAVTTEFAADPLAWVVARHVQGCIRNHLGDADAGVELCRDAFMAAPTAHSRGMAAFLYSVVLLSAGKTQESINVALDAVAVGHRAGLDRSLGGLTDTAAAEGLIRLGRWNEAEAVLARHFAYDTVPMAALRVARAGAMLAARRGDGDRARALLSDARAHPVDGMHSSYLEMGAADVHLVLGEWVEAAAAAERGWSVHPTSALFWSARFTMLTVEAAVEQALDTVAARRPIDLPGVVEHLKERIDAVQTEVDSRTEHRPGRDTAAHLAHATASLSRLTTPDPDAWAEAARQWSALGDRWWTAVARLHEAEAASTASRATSALRAAYDEASELGAAPLLATLEAVSRRTRISLAEPARVDLDAASISTLGLTPREGEVLTLITAGHTNRRIGDELFVSEKTVSVHVSNILRKLNVSSRVDAAALAQRLGMD